MPTPLPPASTYNGPLPKVVYTDVDGTLTHEGSLFHSPSGPSLAAARALHALLSRGIPVLMVSGRAAYPLGILARALGQPRAIAELGAAIVEGGGMRVTPTVPLPPSGRSWYQEIEAREAVDMLFREHPDRLEYHAPWHLGRDFTIIVRGNVDEAATDRFLAARHPDLAFIDNGAIRGGKRAYHVAPRGVTKAHGIATDRALHGIPREAAVALGDSPADAEMAAEVGAFFLVGGNGQPGPANGYSTKREAGDGFAEAVEALLRLPAGSLTDP